MYDIVLFILYIYVFSIQGRRLRCSLSETKYRLFIGNVPKSLSDEEFKKIIDETGPGAENIELIKVSVDWLSIRMECLCFHWHFSILDLLLT